MSERGETRSVVVLEVRGWRDVKLSILERDSSFKPHIKAFELAHFSGELAAIGQNIFGLNSEEAARIHQVETSEFVAGKLGRILDQELHACHQLLTLLHLSVGWKGLQLTLFANA